MRISTKLYLGFGILLGLMVALGGLVTYDMAGVHHLLRRLTLNEIPALTSEVQIARNFTTESTQAHSYLMNLEQWRRKDAESAEILLEAQLRSAMDTAVPADIRRIQQIAANLGEFQVGVRACEKLALQGDTSAAMTRWDQEVAPLADIISLNLDRLRNRSEDETLESANAAMQQGQRLRAVSEVVVLLALLAGVLAAGGIVRSLLKPIRALVRAVDTLAEGDLSARVEWPYLDELGILAADFNRMADRIGSTISELHEVRIALEDRNQALAKAYGTLQQEMELASRVQREILPVDCNYLDVKAAADMVAASDIGGDFYDVLPGRLGPHHLGLVIGDVSGKGIAAALMMVFVVTILREICRRDTVPSEILRRLNRLMLRRFGSEEEMYATCFFGVLDRATLQFSFSKAGHEEPLWFHASTGDCEYLSGPGLFVGMVNEGYYETREIQLEPGDRLVLYTDGIVDARNELGKPFTRERLCQIVEEHGIEDAATLIWKTKGAISAWTGDGPLRDDMTLLVIEVPTGQMPVWEV